MSRILPCPTPSLRRFLTSPLTVLAVLACSAGETTNDPSIVAPGPTPPPQHVTPGSPPPIGGQMPPSTDVIDVPSPAPGATSSDGKPHNLGSETECNGMDDNGNGIIDDVDVGNDGLCDCLNIGFFGEVASDAGSETAQFEAWLLERSSVPVQRLAATETLTAEWLAGVQVLVVGGLQSRSAQSGAAFSEAERAAFDSWLHGGGGVFVLAGYTEDSRDAQPTVELITNTGMSYDLQSVPSEGVIGQGETPPVWLDGIVAPDHPSVEGVEAIGVYYGYPVTGDGTPILQAQGYTLAMVKEVGAGRAFVFADEWITQDVTWSGLTVGGNDPCQQPCQEQSNICRIANEQCERCALEPCSDPNETDLDACTKGCQPSCESETNRCNTYTQQCETCSAERATREQATPRLWLNTLRWLTPQNECQVEIPPIIPIR